MSDAVQEMFSRIAWRYDCANDVLSLGMHRLWPGKVVAAAAVPAGGTVVDLCTGTGELAFAAASALGPDGKVFGLDFTSSMLELAKRKQQQRSSKRAAPIEFLIGDAQSVPLPDAVADAVLIGFGIRNVDEPFSCLCEMRRLLKVGGRAVVLEFGQPKFPVFAQVYQAYCKFLMPAIGGLITGNREAYAYLPETSKHFPAGRVFCEVMRAIGFEQVAAEPLMSGLAYIYSGVKPSEQKSNKDSCNGIS